MSFIEMEKYAKKVFLRRTYFIVLIGALLYDIRKLEINLKKRKKVVFDMAEKGAAKRTRRPRRSVEELLADLERKKERLEKRILKSKQEAITKIGFEILKLANYPLTEFSENVVQKLETDEAYKRALLKDIITKASEKL